MSNKPILLVDFDGVIHSYTSGWKGADIVYDPPVEGAIHFLHEALEDFDVAIYSARSGQAGGISAMKEYIGYCDAQEFGADTLTDKLQFPTEKPPAFLTLDDRCVQFTGTFPDPAELRNFKPWNKQGV